MEYPITPHTKITRLAKRGVYDQAAIYAILDAALFCTLAYVDDGRPFQVPTGFCRIDDTLYIHGSVGSRYMRLLAERRPPVCVGVTLLDGVVLARAAFHHSMNYRSVVLFSHPRPLSDPRQMDQVLEAFTHKMCPGRWADSRKPSPREWSATMTLALPIEEASAKVRTGPPKDEPEDYVLPIWAGVLPLEALRGEPIADPALASGVPLPPYLAGGRESAGGHAR